jgi:hypothetical protein
VKLSDGRERRCHQDQVRMRMVPIDLTPEVSDCEVITEDVAPPTPETYPHLWGYSSSYWCPPHQLGMRSHVPVPYLAMRWPTKVN